MANDGILISSNDPHESGNLLLAVLFMARLKYLTIVISSKRRLVVKHLPILKICRPKFNSARQSFMLYAT